MNNDNNDVVVLNNQSMTESTDDIIASAERRIANLQKVITLAIKITNPNDWVDFNGKPYPTASGSQKIGRLFGVCWREMKTEKILTEDEKGNFYFYKTVALFYLNGKNDLVEATGTCSQKDKFFSSVGGKLKPASEIDETNIMKSSVTNCITNGITSLLGLKNLTWEQLKEGGIDKTKTSKVEYANGGAGGGLISEAQRKRLWAICNSNKIDEERLKEHLKKNYNLDSAKDIKKTDYNKICDWAENESTTNS